MEGESGKETRCFSQVDIEEYEDEKGKQEDKRWIERKNKNAEEKEDRSKED